MWYCQSFQPEGISLLLTLEVAPQQFLGKGVLNICSKFTGEHQGRHHWGELGGLQPPNNFVVAMRSGIFR